MTEDNDYPVEYARRLYDEVHRWYDSADTKAQVVLVIDGAFLTFLSTAIFAKPQDLSAILTAFSGWTWLLLALMTVCLMASVISVILCLWSRIYSASKLEDLVKDAQSEQHESACFAPKVMWFFQMVSSLEEKRFHTSLEAVNGSVEIEVLASQIQILSKNVRKKHRYVNAGFVLAATTLFFFFAAGLSYLVHRV